jgi:hypothetical protein
MASLKEDWGREHDPRSKKRSHTESALAIYGQCFQIRKKPSHSVFLADFGPFYDNIKNRVI